MQESRVIGVLKAFGNFGGRAIEVVICGTRPLISNFELQLIWLACNYILYFLALSFNICSSLVVFTNSLGVYAVISGGLYNII